MDYSQEYRFFDLAVGSPANRNSIKSIEEVNFKDFEGHKEIYASLYRFPASFKEHVEINRTVAGYQGNVWSDYLVFDIDDEDNLDISLLKARLLVENMPFLTDNKYEVFFSGAKGFHIYIHSDSFGGFEPSPDLPKLQARIAKRLAGDIKIDTSIYERNRIFRVVNTINAKTGLHKVWLAKPHFKYWSIHGIKAYAENPQPYHWFESKQSFIFELGPTLLESKSEPKPAPSLPVIQPADKLCIREILGGVKKGERHNAAFRLADHFKKMGLSDIETVHRLTEWNKNNEDNSPADSHFQKVVDDIYSKQYDYGCHDPIMDSHCKTSCILYPSKVGEKKQQPKQSKHVRLTEVTSSDVAWLWKPYVPLGKVTLIEGDPDIGKSWILLSLATALTRGKALPGSSRGMTGKTLLLMGEDSLGDTVKPRLEMLGADLTQIFALEDPISFNEHGLNFFEELVRDTGPTLVVVDPLMAYLGTIDINRSNDCRTIMSRLGRIADRHKAAIVCLRHLTKETKENTNSNPLYRGIGSIDLAAACRSVLRVKKFADSNVRQIIQIKNNLHEKGEVVNYMLTEGGLRWVEA